ncbi:alkaline-phosphatase-like protein [Plectosphaerella plurivora]|uniref:Alkaline-phosphatase-like protein n=1 Tax=Plectosphaerella plurivora TaxID=936078 RepID=A0A9P8V1W2_9PEZI|nr:alkaline-phosphatase-like protein [Plectosphaerella plurivora]
MPKNILLLIADDLGREQIGCYGSRMQATPNLDELARSGTRFDMAFTSTASCSGSRTVIYTGLHTHQNGSYGLTHGRNGFQTLPDVETGPAAFNRLGYKTGIVGKVHVGPDSAYPWQVRYESDTRNVADIVRVACAFMKDAAEDKKPFFLTIGFVDPHRHVPSRAGFGNVEGNYDPQLRDRIFIPDEVEVPPFLSDIPEVRAELAEYMRAVYRMDQGVGRVLQGLRDNGLESSTLVLFLSDNGPPFVNSKTTLFDAGVRLPFILRAPGVGAAGVENPNLVSYVDILPTLLDWGGHGNLQPPAGMVRRRGRSVLPILNRTEPEPGSGWDHVLGSHTFHEVTNYWPTRFMRDRRYKYHRNPPPATIGRRKLADYIRRAPEELYDLEEDADELVNLAADPAHRHILLAMRSTVEAWQEETGDPWLWRDGVSVTRYIASNYAREGLVVPDCFDFDLDNESSTTYNLLREAR